MKNPQTAHQQKTKFAKPTPIVNIPGFGDVLTGRKTPHQAAAEQQNTKSVPLSELFKAHPSIAEFFRSIENGTAGQAAAQTIPPFWLGVPGMAELFSKGGTAPATQTSNYSSQEREFIDVIIEASESFTLIQKSISHVMRLVRAGADESRIIAALMEIQGICDDSQESISCTGLSWD